MNIELTPQVLYIIFFLSVYNGILLGLAITVYYQNRRSLTNLYFAVFLFIIIFWFNLTFIYSNLFLLPHIFYPLGLTAGTFLAPAFYSTKTIGNNIGLGLYIVKDLIINLGWDIKVSSEEGKGTTFCIIVKE